MNQQILDKLLELQYDGDFFDQIQQTFDYYLSVMDRQERSDEEDKYYVKLQKILNLQMDGGAKNREKIHQILKDLGFTEIEAIILSEDYGKYKLDSDVIDDIERSYSPQEVIDILIDVDLFLSKLISTMIYKIDYTQTYLDILQEFGLDKYILETIFLYPSGRPKTDMSVFGDIPTLTKKNISDIRLLTSEDNVLFPRDWLNKITEIHQTSLVPVVRYAYGMSRGLYYSNKGEFCGVFYYYEPLSNVFLKAKDILIAPNKFMALFHLTDKNTLLKYMTSYVDDYGDINTRQKSKSPLQPDVFQQHSSLEEAIDDMISGRYNFLEHSEDLYAVEDRFDQIICKTAKDKFDLIILTTITGKNRVVTEVLDTRNKAESYKSLFKIDDDVVDEAAPLITQ